MNGDKKSFSLGILLFGILDVLLIVIFIFSIVSGNSSAEITKQNSNSDFSENVDDYTLDFLGKAYSSAVSITYNGNNIKESEVDEEENSNDRYAGFVFPNSDTSLLTEEEIEENISQKATLRRAINEIYARHGYQFTQQENIDYFNQFDWYRTMEKETDMDKVSEQFNSIEKKNVDKLQIYSNSKGWS